MARVPIYTGVLLVLLLVPTVEAEDNFALSGEVQRIKKVVHISMLSSVCELE